MRARRLYVSENGDTWDLAGDGDRVFIVHRPNLASGGKSREIELDAFLAHERHTAQVVALVRMIGSLLEEDD